MRLLEAALRNARGALGTGWPPHDNASRGEDEQRGEPDSLVVRSGVCREIAHPFQVGG
jgi:hypothetical protein